MSGTAIIVLSLIATVLALTVVDLKSKSAPEDLTLADLKKVLNEQAEDVT